MKRYTWKASQIRQQFTLIISLRCLAIAIALLIVSSTMTSQILSVDAAKNDDRVDDVKGNDHNDNNDDGDLDSTLFVNTDKDSERTSNALVEECRRRKKILRDQGLLSADSD